MGLSVNKDYANSRSVDTAMITKVVEVDLNTGKQIGATSDPASYPAAYDYFTVTSYDASGNPLVIEFYNGGSYNTGTGAYTSGTLAFTHYFKYDGSGRFTSRYVAIA